MNALALTLLIPLAATIGMALFGQKKSAGYFNVVVSFAQFIASLFLTSIVFKHGHVGEIDGQFYIDSFNVYLIALTALVGATTALFSRPYMEQEQQNGRLSTARMRLYHASYQGFLFTMQLALSTNNLGILWVALEGATLATVLLVSLYRTPAAIEAAWKYFIICGVGIAQALFGTVLIYFAAAQVIPNPEQALLWRVLVEHASSLQPAIMAIAFVFLLVGYGTKVGLVPMHTWLPDAHSEGPTPMSAVLSGLLLNVALYARGTG